LNLKVVDNLEGFCGVFLGVHTFFTVFTAQKLQGFCGKAALAGGRSGASAGGPTGAC
jgi:hypothetical protein